MDNKQVQAIRLSETPCIDGRLNDKVWNTLPLLTDFIQYSPYNGQPSSQITEVRIGYDDQAIYIAANCFDQYPEEIKQEISIRDQHPPGMNADLFAVLISPFDDGLNSVFLWVTAAGVQRDVKIYGDEHEIDWDAVWESRIQITHQGWTAELKIPFSVLRFSTQSVQDWGLNLWRWIARNREWAVWNPVEITYPGWWKKNGQWNDVMIVRSPFRLSFTPYISNYLENDLNNKWRNFFNWGMDVKYGITKSFTADITLIPDFGQLQSDNIELNLSPYEIKYNEKRQFFTEGSELFHRGDLFYSRRIGDLPLNYEEIFNEIDENEVVYKNPTETRLINASKFSGRTHSGLGIGVINAMTANTYAIILNQSTGEKRKVLTQPFTNYNMIILDQTLFAHSYLSLVNSNVSRKGYLANITAVDFQLTDQSNTYGLSGIFGHSWIWSDQQNKSGNKVLLKGGKIGGNFQATYNLSLITDNYDQNDFGYLRRNNEVVNQLSVSHRISRPFACFLTFQNHLNLLYGRRFSPNDFSEFIYSYNFSTEFRNYYYLGLTVEYTPLKRKNYYEPRVENRYFINYKYIKYRIYGTTDPRKALWIELEGAYSRSYNYGFNVNTVSLEMLDHINLGNHLNFGLQSSYEKCINQPGYVNQNPDIGIIYFGRRDRETVVNTLESSYLFTNMLSLSFRLRHYYSKVVYDCFYELRQNGRLTPSDYESNHNINYNAFNIDCTLRWNFAPGSEILLNWKNSIYNSDQCMSNNYWNNFTSILDHPQVNSVSLKFIYFYDI